MKLTKTKLKEIIQEEIQAVVLEQQGRLDPKGVVRNIRSVLRSSMGPDGKYAGDIAPPSREYGGEDGSYAAIEKEVLEYIWRISSEMAGL
jgi:hypothetical protein